jgi:hypothetical protein
LDKGKKMAVLLSPFAGVGAQLLDNNGNILAGGKIYTYAAGTNTPATVYTNSSGAIAHLNPIILDASGRVPGGEIWLVDGQSYKFVVQDAYNNLIATYDNIVGINSNFLAYTSQQEIQTATAGQTVFTLTTMTYLPNTNNLAVYVDGVNQYGPGSQYAYVETSPNVVTFENGLHVGALVKFTSATPVSASQNAANIPYDPPFTGGVQESVAAKLQQTVSVKDFGAVGDGTTDDTAAVQSAVNYCVANDYDLIVNGLCYLTNTININRAVNDPTYDKFFTIFSNSGGGFIVKDDTAMFGSSLTYTINPVSQLVRFENVSFETDDAFLTQAFVLDGNKFLRTEFVGCSFRKIKLLNASSTGQYIQSLYITGCNMRRWLGVFLNAQQGIFDFKFNNNICEAGENCLNLRSPVGCSVTNNLIEGMSDTAITFDAAQSLLISGNYFEGNTVRDIADASSGATGSKTVTVVSNFFDPYARTSPCVYWGDTILAVAAGNYMKTVTGTLHKLSSGSFVNITDYSEGVNADAPSYTYMRDLYNANGLGTNYGGVIRGTSVAGQGGKLILGVLNNDVAVEHVTVDEVGRLTPIVNNNQPLGTSSLRWSFVYATQFIPGSGNVTWSSGSGSPEGVVTAPIGSLWTRTDGGANTTLYVKESGSGNTGWVAK